MVFFLFYVFHLFYFGFFIIFHLENFYLFFLKNRESFAWKSWEVYPEKLGKSYLKISESLPWKSWEVWLEKLGKFCLKNQIRQNRKSRNLRLENPWKIRISIIEIIRKYWKIVLDNLHEYHIIGIAVPQAI